MNGRYPLGQGGPGDRLGDALLCHLLDLEPHHVGELDAGAAAADRVVSDHDVVPRIPGVEELTDLEINPEQGLFEARPGDVNPGIGRHLFETCLVQGDGHDLRRVHPRGA